MDWITLVKSCQTEKCLHCGQTFILRWLTTTQEVQVFLASKRMYEDAKSRILVHRAGCETNFWRELNGKLAKES